MPSVDKHTSCRLCNLDCATDYHLLFLAFSFTDQVLVRRVLLWCWIETVSYKARNILVYAIPNECGVVFWCIVCAGCCFAFRQIPEQLRLGSEVIF